MLEDDNSPNPTSSETEPDGAVPERLDPQAFPHPPTPGQGFPATIENVRHLLAGNGFTARFNVLKKRVELRQHGRIASINQIASAAMLNRIGTGWLNPFVGEISLQNPLNPIRDWIASKGWDGIDRFRDFSDTVLAESDYPESLKSALLYRWMLAATAAALADGPLPIHGVLTLQGDQGIGKTSWIARLLPPHLRDDYIKLDHHLDASNKDSIIGCITHFIVEIGELDSSFKKDIARIKGFLTNDFDKLRRPYGKDEVEYPRKTIFAATVNDERFLVDPTGNRRWWTIAVRGLNFKHDIDMQQLFAQLAVDFERGEQWWLTPSEASELAAYNLRHRAVSAIAERIADYINPEANGFEGGSPKTAIEVLQEIGVSNPTNAQCKECGSVLRELYGPPKRIQGRDRWRVHVRPLSQGVSPKEDPPEIY